MGTQRQFCFLNVAPSQTKLTRKQTSFTSNVRWDDWWKVKELFHKQRKGKKLRVSKSRNCPWSEQGPRPSLRRYYWHINARISINNLLGIKETVVLETASWLHFKITTEKWWYYKQIASQNLVCPASLIPWKTSTQLLVPESRRSGPSRSCHWKMEF